jgi:hypothetical protein
MTWTEERDALIAQTKAFVEQIARRSVDVGRSGARSDARPVPRDTVIPPREPPPPQAPPSTIRDWVRGKADETAALPSITSVTGKFDQVSMSSEIRARIAAFRAHQERFNRERHDYFNATLARLRAEINELPAPVRRPADDGVNGRGSDPGSSRTPPARVPPRSRG